MKKTLSTLGIVAILFTTLFCVECIAQNADQSCVRVFGKLPTADSQVEIFAVSHPYEPIGEHNEQFPCTISDGRYEALLPPGWYRFRVQFNDTVNTGAVLHVQDKEINRDLVGLLKRPAKNVAATTENPFDVAAFPEQFAERVAQLEKDTPENKGIVIVGRIVDAQGKPMGRGDYDTELRWGNIFYGDPVSFEDGWFHTRNFITPFERRLMDAGERHPDWGKTAKFYVYTATNEPAMVEIPIELGTVHYAEIVLEKTPENELVSLSGTVLDEEGQPMDGVSVNIRCSHVGSDMALKRTTTDKEGRFSFEKMTPQAYRIVLTKRGYPYQSLPEIHLSQLGDEHIFHYRKLRSVEIEYVYQPDGSSDFTKGNLQPQTVTLEQNPNKGFHFATAQFTEGSRSNRDISLNDRDGRLLFTHTYTNAVNNRFYDAGEVPFESESRADEYPDVPHDDWGGYPPLPVKLNHVYVVKTTEGKYAKFVVRKITPPLPANIADTQ